MVDKNDGCVCPCNVGNKQNEKATGNTTDYVYILSAGIYLILHCCLENLKALILQLSQALDPGMEWTHSLVKILKEQLSELSKLIANYASNINSNSSIPGNQ